MANRSVIHDRHLALLYAMLRAKGGIPVGIEWEYVAHYFPKEITACAVSQRWSRLRKRVPEEIFPVINKNEKDVASPVKATPKKAAAKRKPCKKGANAVEEWDEKRAINGGSLFSDDEEVGYAAADDHESESFKLQSPKEEQEKTTAWRPTVNTLAANLPSADGNGNDEVQVAKSPTPGPEKRGPRRPKASIRKAKGKGKAIVAKKTGPTAEDSGVEDVDQESEYEEVIADTPPASPRKRIQPPRAAKSFPRPVQGESDSDEDYVD